MDTTSQPRVGSELHRRRLGEVFVELEEALLDDLRSRLVEADVTIIKGEDDDSEDDDDDTNGGTEDAEERTADDRGTASPPLLPPKKPPKKPPP